MSVASHCFVLKELFFSGKTLVTYIKEIPYSIENPCEMQCHVTGHLDDPTIRFECDVHVPFIQMSDGEIIIANVLMKKEQSIYINPHVSIPHITLRACFELENQNANVNVNTNANANVNTNVNTNTNANANANANVNVNVNANANSMEDKSSQESPK